MNYLRVIPRALFVHDGRAGRLTVSHEDPETGFAICQPADD